MILAHSYLKLRGGSGVGEVKSIATERVFAIEHVFVGVWNLNLGETYGLAR